MLWAGGALVVVMLGVWFLEQAPEELTAWIREERPAARPPPKPVVQAPVPKRTGPCRGLTTTLTRQDKFTAHVGSNADAPCEAMLSVLCVKGSELRASAPVSGRLLISREVADSICGTPWKMLHAPVGFHGQGELPPKARFWIAGDSQSNPWD